MIENYIKPVIKQTYNEVDVFNEGTGTRDRDFNYNYEIVLTLLQNVMSKHFLMRIEMVNKINVDIRKRVGSPINFYLLQKCHVLFGKQLQIHIQNIKVYEKIVTMYNCVHVLKG